ncbi:MAG: MGMT family protein [Bacteroidetes bacterium]|nr:MGMT family protein [Bacteroidota bacterium]
MAKDHSSFFEKVYDVVRLVPYGRATTYGDIAKYLGTGSSARMVGWAMNACHGSMPPVPAHRVVNRLGMLTGKSHFESPNMMQQLLESEGVKVKGDKIVDFKKVRWVPAEEL